MREKDELDSLLDAAIPTYADPGPDSGLEQRVLARVSAENSVVSTPAPRRIWLPWSMALAGACCLLLFVLISAQKRIHPPIHNAQSARLSNALPATAAHRAPMPMVPRSTVIHDNRPSPKGQHAAVHKFAPLPKRDVFPTPEPLTRQEQALIAFAAQASQPEIQAVVQAQKQDEAPLSIAAIHIQPLEPPEQGQE